MTPHSCCTCNPDQFEIREYLRTTSDEPHVSPRLIPMNKGSSGCSPTPHWRQVFHTCRRTRVFQYPDKGCERAEHRCPWKLPHISEGVSPKCRESANQIRWMRGLGFIRGRELHIRLGSEIYEFRTSSVFLLTSACQLSIICGHWGLCRYRRNQQSKTTSRGFVNVALRTGIVPAVTFFLPVS